MSNSVVAMLNNHLLKYFDARLVRRSRLYANGAALFPPGTWVMFELPGGLKLWIDLGDVGVSLECMAGRYEIAETRFILDNLKEGDTFLDIGANIGWFAVQAAAKTGAKGRIIAIEPRTQTGAYLARSLQANGFMDRSEVHHCAAGAQAGRVSIVWNGEAGNPGGTWSLPDKQMLQEFREDCFRTEEVPVQTVDAVVGDRRVDMIKIDIEGAEGLALRGAMKTLSQSRPVILSEMNFPLLPKISGLTAGDYVRWMAQQRYQCHSLTAEGGTGPVLAAGNLPGHMTFINVIFKPMAV
ncbi:MAG: FkbM family methyltransferase [Alphaproteobacteria bacterium]|nr:FkbM family methyltransferase [Alphaproteobacteria bacterium]